MSLLLALMLLASLSEILSIGAVLPFLSALTAPGKVFSHPMAQPMIEVMGFEEPTELIAPLAIAFGLAALMAAVMRLVLLWVSTRLSFACGADMSIDMYRRTLYQPYAVHLARNSSEVITAISAKSVAIINQALTPTLTLISTFVMLVMILPALTMLNPFIALSTFAGFGFLYVILIRFTKRRQHIDSERVAHESSRRLRALQEGLGGIRDVLLDGTQQTYCREYRNADLPMRRAQGNAIIVGQSPRFVVEGLGMVLIAFLAYLLAQRPGGVASVIPLLGTFALGAQRLLPILQQGYYSLSSLRAGRASVQDALKLLEQPLPDLPIGPQNIQISFRRTIDLQNVGFQYSPETPWVLRDLDLLIERGSRVGFIGVTGSGKSTLIDLIMGLLEPVKGNLKIDDVPITFENQRAWQAHIAHVPQAIFLADVSIAENIALGVPPGQIDMKRVEQAAYMAQIADAIENLPRKYQTLVGERGVRLSGGQRQRIGIARALYKQAEVIIFDEATSALDTETEKMVMAAIESLGSNLTVLIVAHRLSTLENCDAIFELKDGHIDCIGDYGAVMKLKDMQNNR